MKTLFLGVGMFCFVLLSAGCSSYDAYREKQTERLKQNYIEDVRSALKGELTKTRFESGLQSHDTAIINERTKNGKGLEELKAKLDEETKRAVDETKGLK